MVSVKQQQWRKDKPSDVKLFARSERRLESLIDTVRVVSKDIRMQFGISKCAMLVMWRGKVTKTDGIRMPDDRDFYNLEKSKSYKYLGVLESVQMWCREMKSNVTKEYFRRIRTLPKSKLNGGNVTRAVNTWAVSSVQYTAAFIDWSRKELRNPDRKTRKYVALYNAFQPRDSAARFYLPRNGGGRGLIAVKDSVELSKASLAK